LSENKILVVDDDRSVSTVVRMTLEDQYDVSTVDSAVEAFEHMAANKVDLVLLDIKMPWMSGLEALEKIRKRYPEMTVVMMTAYPTEDNVRRSMKSGAKGFIAKPFELDELRDYVDKTLSEKGK